MFVSQAGFPGELIQESRGEGDEMRRDDLMKPDLLCEAILLGIGVAMFVALLMTVLAAFTRVVALR